MRRSPSVRPPALLLLLTGAQVYVQLTSDMGWTREQVEEWMTVAVLHHLFGL
jgi:hypothetical protein